MSVSDLSIVEVMLKPCPFCGGDELSHGWSSPGVDGSASTGEVQCHSCDALLWKETESEAIAAWNTRASTASEAERVREACAKVVENLPWDDNEVGNANFDDTKAYAAAAIRSLPITGRATGEDIVHAVEFRDVAISNEEKPK